MTEELDVLRSFRDRYLLSNPVGEAVVELYYSTSPPIADFIAHSPSLRAVIRTGLTPVVGMSHIILSTTPIQKLLILASLTLCTLTLGMVIRLRRGTKIAQR
jgi:hypothetical protein